MVRSRNRYSLILAVKAMVDQIWKEPPIPVLPVMVGRTVVEDRAKADRFLGLAKQFAEDNDHPTAIQMLSSAFAFTNKSEDYELLP